MEEGPKRCRGEELVRLGVEDGGEGCGVRGNNSWRAGFRGALLAWWHRVGSSASLGGRRETRRAAPAPRSAATFLERWIPRYFRVRVELVQGLAGIRSEPAVAPPVDAEVIRGSITRPIRLFVLCLLPLPGQPPHDRGRRFCFSRTFSGGPPSRRILSSTRLFPRPARLPLSLGRARISSTPTSPAALRNLLLLAILPAACAPLGVAVVRGRRKRVEVPAGRGKTLVRCAFSLADVPSSPPGLNSGVPLCGPI